MTSFFNKNFLISFKNKHYSGYSFHKSNKFIYLNKTEKLLESKPEIEIRFLCDLTEVISTYNMDVLGDKVSSQNQTPFFTLIPYFSEKPDEAGEALKAYQPLCEFKITFNFKTQRSKFEAKNYGNTTNFTDLKNKIRKILNSQTTVKSSLKKTHTPKYQNQICIESDIHESKTTIINSIQEMIDHMIKGECYLANLTYTYQIPYRAEFFNSEFFIQKCFTNYPAFGFFFHSDDISLVSYSPERFLLKSKNKIATQPIKGTCAIKEQKTLWKNKKELQEHTMAIDLLRHDLNAICKPGSVKVQKPFFLKKCDSIIQMQSSLVGDLKKNLSIKDILTSVLPAGSITGTPKKMTCALLEKYEKNSRGYYTGIVGIIETNKDFDFSLLIRSYFRGRNGTYVGVGAGITTLSNPNVEFEEFCLKLKSFL